MVKPLRLLFLTVLLINAVHLPLRAQHTFGVVWNIPPNPREAVEQLQQFKSLGITVIEIKKPPVQAVWETIDRLNFEVYGHLGIRFPLTHTFAEADSSFIRFIEKRASAFLRQPSVSALGLFEFGPVYKKEFIEAVEPFADQIRKAAGMKVYIVSSSIHAGVNSIADFVIHSEKVTRQNVHSLELPAGPVIKGYHFSVTSGLKGLFRPFDLFLKEAASHSPEVIFVTSDWLLELNKKYPDFGGIFRSLSREAEPVFIVPDETLPRPGNPALPVLILLISWGLTAFLYASSPLYRKSLFRYFSGHRFFVKDIFDRHLRSPVPAWTIIFENALLIAAGIHASFSALLSPLGKAALFYHFPALSVTGNGLFSLFVLSFAVVTALSFIFVIWLSLHKELNSITQVATIFAWPLQLNLVIVTLAVALFSATGNATLTTLLTLTAVAVFLSSFILASFDTARSVKSKPKLYILITGGVYITAIGAIITWSATQKALWEALGLALNLK